MTVKVAHSPADADLLQRLEIHLRNQGRYNLTRLQVAVADGVVVLRGRVSSFHERQLAVTHCQRVAGVLKLVDEIEVDSAS